MRQTKPHGSVHRLTCQSPAVRDVSPERRGWVSQCAQSPHQERAALKQGVCRMEPGASRNACSDHLARV